MTGVLLRFCATMVAVPLTVWLLPGVHAASGEAAWFAGAVLGVVYLVLRPIAKLLLSPLNCLTMGVLGFVVDVGLVGLVARWMPGFAMDSIGWLLAVAVAIWLLREFAGALARTE